MLNPLAKIYLPILITEMSHQDTDIQCKTYSSNCFLVWNKFMVSAQEKKCDRWKRIKMPFTLAVFLPLDLGLGVGLLFLNMQNTVGSYKNASCHMTVENWKDNWLKMILFDFPFFFSLLHLIFLKQHFWLV